ncbi:MAG: AAA family ATPase [Nitrospira sp.]|nr:AAA family ATPase [Nitrospira sp.]
MFLREITIENLRSLKDVDLCFLNKDGTLRKWTLLLGENGTGKSTVLKGIALVTAGSEALPEILGSPSSWVRLGANRCVIQATIETMQQEERLLRLEIKKGDGVSEILRRNHKSLEQLDRALKHTTRNYLTAGYGVSRRLSSVGGAVIKEEAFRNPRSRSIATLFNSDARLNSLESWAMDLDYRKGPAGINMIKRAMDRLLPEATFAKIDRRKKQVLFRTADGLVPLNMLSDGYQNVAAWTGDLLYRITEAFSNYSNPFQARGLLLIDEIDLHLHPVWQRKLREFLSTSLPNFQIVGTTHSALTAQQAGEGELYVAKRKHARNSPELLGYEGDPQKLMLHQLFLSEVFSLPSLSSPQVVAMKDEFRQLKSKGRRSGPEKKKFKKLKSELEDIPDWTRETKADKARNELLKRIGKALKV